MKTLLLVSTPMPFGLHKVVALGVPAQLPVLVPVRPNTSEAEPPTHGKVFAHGTKGVLNSNARLLPASDTYRLPLLSTATPVGSARECMLSPPVFCVPVSKSGCPRTRSAGASSAKEVTLFHPSTR